MKLYKLTDKNHKTQNNTVWGPNISNEVSGEGKELCTKYVIHAYKHPLLAAFFKPIHCSSYTKLWEAEGDIVVDDGTKVGVKKLTTLKEVELPIITREQRVNIAILCVKEVYKDEKWNNWADKWLSGKDRSAGSAAVFYAADDADDADDAAAAATRAARAAACAARAAATHADPYDYAAAGAASAACVSVFYYAACADKNIDITSIIKKVITI